MVRGRCIVPMALLLSLSGCTVATVPTSLEQSVEKYVAAAAAAPVGATPATAFQWEIDQAATGLDIKALAEHEALCKETGADACLVVYQGKIVQEYRSERYNEPFWAMSATKSVTALLVGMLIDAGKIKSVDEPACTYLTDWCDGDKGNVTLRDLLTMTAGLGGWRRQHRDIRRHGDNAPGLCPDRADDAGQGIMAGQTDRQQSLA